MAGKILVRNKFHCPDDTTGQCPHCGKSISAYRSIKACEHCRKPITWEWNELSAAEREEEIERCRIEKEKAIRESRVKPCPFCGELVGPPSIQIFKAEKPYLYLSIGCFACHIELTELTFKAEMQSLQEANETLIKKWNTRWKNEPT